MDEIIGEELGPRPEEPWFIWYFKALGFRYALLLPLVAVVSLILVAIVATRCKNRMLAPLLVALVPLPIYFGIVSAVDGLAATILYMSNTRGPEIAEGGAMSLAGLEVGLWLALPGFLLTIGVLTWRSLTEHAEQQSDDMKIRIPPI